MRVSINKGSKIDGNSCKKLQRTNINHGGRGKESGSRSHVTSSILFDENVTDNLKFDFFDL